LQGIKTFLNSQKMKAVRAPDIKQLASLNKTLLIINRSEKYSQVLSSLLQNGSSLRECLTILVRSAQPLVGYDESINAIEALLKYPNELPHELFTALSDISSLIRNEENSFLINLSNQKQEMVNSILSLGNTIYSSSESIFLNRLSNYLGSKNVIFLHDMLAARAIYESLLQPLLNLPELANNINPAIHFSMADMYLNKLIFGRIRTNEDFLTYKNSVCFLLLVESENCYKVASVLKAANRVNDFSAVVNQVNNFGNACLSAFEYIQP
jgi:hypothetical protein